MTARLLVAAVDVGVRYGTGRNVLDGATVELATGRRLAVLGANGSGKTTLLRVLSGALAPRSGEVLLDGQRLRHSRTALNEHRRRVQLVLQDPAAQLFSADVYQDVAFGPLNLGLPAEVVRERVTSSLETLSILDLADRPVHQLSSGQQKRVALAGAVAMRPDLLLLDEPTAGLDPRGTAELLECLEVLEAGGTTVVLSTHDVALAWSWADDVAVVSDRRVIQGPAVAMLTDDARLAGSRLDPPWQVRLLRALGHPVEVEPRAREVAEVVALVQAAAHGPRPT